MNVQFNGLGLEFELRRWAFEILGMKIYWYGIIIALAFLVAVLLAVKSCKKYDIEPDNILDLVLFAAPAAIIGARLFYVIFSWDQFKDNLLEIFNTRNGGLAIYGGVTCAILVAWIYAKKKKIPFLHLMDFTVPYLILGQGIGRWGNFVNQEAFGSQTNLPWRMNGEYANDYLTSFNPNIDLTQWGVHPTFLYESLWDIAVFLFLIFYRKKKKMQGEVLFLYLILYGVGRFFIEGLRTDSLMLGSMRISQLLSFLLVIMFTALFIYGRVKKEKELEEEPVDLGQSQYGSLLMKLKEQEQAEEETKEDAKVHVKSEDDTDEVKADEDNADEDNANEDNANEDNANEDNANEDKTVEDKTVEDKIENVLAEDQTEIATESDLEGKK